MLVQEEMRQTRRYLQHQQSLWQGRVVGTLGQQCYARKQAALWMELGDDAGGQMERLRLHVRAGGAGPD